MALGGIPYYWSFVRKGQSAAQVIDELLFVDGAPLREEYVNLLASLFDHSKQHERILLSLAGKRKGLPRNEMLKASQLDPGEGLPVLSESWKPPDLSHPTSHLERSRMMPSTGFRMNLYCSICTGSPRWENNRRAGDIGSRDNRAQAIMPGRDIVMKASA